MKPNNRLNIPAKLRCFLSFCGAVKKNLPKSFALWEVDLTKSKTEGAAMQSITVEVADCKAVGAIAIHDNHTPHQ